MDTKHHEVLKFITTLRESDKYIETIYLNGGCYQFHLVLKTLYPEAEPFTTPTKDHIVTYIDGVYYDIRGIYEEATVLNIPVDMLEDIKMWSFASTYCYVNNYLSEFTFDENVMVAKSCVADEERLK